MTPRAKVWDELPKVAVRVAVNALETAATVAVKVAAVAPAVTVTLAGTVTLALLLASATLAPLVKAAELSVTVHVDSPGEATLEGLQETPLSAGAAASVKLSAAGFALLMVTDCEAGVKVYPLKLGVTV